LNIVEKTAEEPLYIEFDGRQIEFTTNIVEAAVFAAGTFRHMLVKRRDALVASVSMTQTATGYTIRGAEEVEYQLGDLPSLLPLLKDEIRLQFMRSRPDLLWLHAAAVERNGNALLIAGRSGQGKSTLSTHLCDNGWRLLSDDVAPVRMTTDTVIPFPQTPVRRMNPGRTVADVEIPRLSREVIAYANDAVFRAEAELGAVLFVRFDMDSDASLQSIRPGPAALELLRNLTNFMDHRGTAVDRAADLARRLPAYSLIWSDPSRAVKEIDALPLSRFG
jgi:hypothetical protein